MAVAHPGEQLVEIDFDPAVFQKIANIEKDFAKVELDALRQKEFALKPLYTKRNTLTSQLPDFWPQVLMNGPQEFQSILGEADQETLEAVKSLSIERYQIKSATEGEPRSLRFTFEFEKNDWFEDTTVVKEFEYVTSEDDNVPGGLVSKPVSFKWKKKGKKSNNGFLDLAMDLYKAEEAVKLRDGKSGADLEIVEREGLWQYEKLREKLEKAAEDQELLPSWLDFFGYRGAVARKAEKKEDEAANGKVDDEEDEDMDEDDEDDGLLDVEIFPTGEEIAFVLADDLWPNVMDYFMASQEDPMMEDFDGVDSDEELSGEDEDDVPDLVEVVDTRPTKRHKKN